MYILCHNFFQLITDYVLSIEYPAASFDTIWNFIRPFKKISF